jgi:hypothetical protein
MIVHTESGSRYELDTKERRARKLTGAHTEMTADGWRDYRVVFGPTLGHSMLIVWRAPGKLCGDRGTQTSRVTWVER